MSTDRKKPNRIVRLKGGGARNFFAERLVDEYGDAARDYCAGPMLDAVNEVLQHRASDATGGAA